jgi:hypothetical protein
MSHWDVDGEAAMVLLVGTAQTGQSNPTLSHAEWLAHQP